MKIMEELPSAIYWKSAEMDFGIIISEIKEKMNLVEKAIQTECSHEIIGVNKIILDLNCF